MPAKAGIQNYLISLDSRLRGNDAKGVFKTFYETINVEHRIMMSLRFIYFKTNEPQNTEPENPPGGKVSNGGIAPAAQALAPHVA